MANPTISLSPVKALVAELGDKVSLPGSTSYDSSLASYFSQQESQTLPACIVSATTAEDVVTVVRLLASAGAAANPSYRFAIRSGGHMCFAGAANIAGGVTLDLRLLKDISVSSDRRIVSAGAGATWGDIYTMLDPLGLCVAGGRAAQVGVGGLVTGGGVSYFSPRYGWTCDTVANFQVVLADGSIVEARDDPELLVALRGGSNNLGVVTRVDLEAFEQGPIWGGTVYYPLSTIDGQLRAFVDFNSVDKYDRYASLITSFGYSAAQGQSAVVNSLEYTKAEERPPVFEPFMKLPSLHSTMRIAPVHDISLEQGAFSPIGLRETYVVTTHRSTLPMVDAVYKSWDASLEGVKNIENVIWSISMEPLPPAIYKCRDGGKANILGLADRDDALVLTLLSASWTNAQDDAKVEAESRSLFARIEARAHELGDYDPFLYVNYTAPWQDPIPTYGAEKVELLRRVRDRVDPGRVFTHQVPGGFKIPGENGGTA